MDYRPRKDDTCDWEYYSTGGCYRPPKKPRNHGSVLALAGVILLCLAAYIAWGQRLAAEDEQTVRQTVTAQEALAADQTAETPAPRESVDPPAAETAETAEIRTTEGGFSLPISRDRSSSLELTELYKKLIPSVTSITALSDSAKSTGTGIVMSADGYIITNNHVVSGAKSITVLLSSDEEYEAVLVGGDETSDLAVLKIDAENLTPAEFGVSDSVEVGDAVVAIGDPLGTELRGTMTDGIICGINRDVKVGSRTMTLMQTNAALNAGNSGGPLVNMAGQVIGINTMKLRSYYNAVEGIGFAIPVSSAAPILEELAQKGYVSGRPAFGVVVETLSPQMRLFYNLPGSLCVQSVLENSDAWKEGVAPGDIIVAVDGEQVSTMEEFNTLKNDHTAGDTVRLTLYRKGMQFDVDVELMDRADLD